jgi:hypothetical protein
VIANPLNYHYAFFWDEANAFIGYYKTNKGIATNGAYLGQVNTQSIPLPLNAYSFALVRYDNDYVLVNGFTIEDLFIDNNLAGVDPNDFNDIPIAELNGLTLNEVFDNGNLVDFSLSTLVNATGTINNFTPTAQFGRVIAPAISLSGNRVYVVSSIKGAFNTVELFTNLPNTAAAHSGSNQFETLSILFTSTGSNGFRVHDIRTTGFLPIEVQYLFAYNITALGLTSLTKAQLDTYFNIYQNGVNATYYATDGNVSTVDGYYYASGKNLFDKNNIIVDLRITANTGVLSISSITNISNFINIKPSTTYTVLKGLQSGSFGHAFYDINQVYISGIISNILGPQTFTTPSNAYFIRLTIVDDDLDTQQLEQAGAATTYEAFATPTTTLNLTFLFGVGNEPNKATMDGYYQDYEDWQDYSFILPLAFNTQTISFETIYFDDGVSTEIERLGSILIFTLIGFTLMIFGFASKRRIFNLLAVGAFVVLGFLLIEFVGFIIILFGLIFVNVYYTFFGEL